MEEYELGKKLYKKVTVDGKTVGRWVIFAEINEYDEEGNKIHTIREDGFEEWVAER